ncbi:transglycosylase SLT domain-containing protein [Aquabacterium sp.]|uniref:transglycosylase SLT domain-containing protein n=1 Tax=Aquabacterium sp. TaxID=1872578 RepID=UPI003B6C75AC
MMLTKHPAPRTLLLSASTVFTLLLSACGTTPLPAQQGRAGIDVDKLLAAGNTPRGDVVSRGATRQDPSSGLQVELSPATLLARTSAVGDSADSTTPGEAIGAPTDPLRPEATINLDDASATQDLWGRIRKGYTLPELDSPLVADHERWYTSRPDYVQRMTQRGSRYLFHVVEEISRRNMPTELALLPFIESAFNPQAMSSARASGMWQFMPATGKDFELKQNLFRDDRRDVLASTRAALDYLQRLNRMFGDWHLALAAYNWGEGNVQRAIKRNQQQGLPTDYLSLNMPPETRNYVPKLHAVRNIIARPEAYGLTLTPVENHPYFVSVPIQRDIDVALATRLAGLPVDEFKALNPSQNKPVILAAGTPQLLLPYNNANLFVHNLTGHNGTLASWTAWQVPKTMHPSDVAKRVGMSEAQLREINHIPPKMLVKAGSTLLVPRSQHKEEDVSVALADNAMMALAPDVPPLRRMTLKAGKRDTVKSIAQRYGVSPQQLAQWNKVGSSASFQRGQTVVVFVANKANGKVVASKDGTKDAKGRRAEERRGPAKTARVVASVSRSATQKSAAKTRNAPAARSSRVRVASAR